MTKPLSAEEKAKRKAERENKEVGHQRQQALQEIKMYQSNDWDLVEENTSYFLMKRNRATFGGHLLVLILTGWFTFGIGNLIYHFASVQKKKIIK